MKTSKENLKQIENDLNKTIDIVSSTRMNDLVICDRVGSYIRSNLIKAEEILLDTIDELQKINKMQFCIIINSTSRIISFMELDSILYIDKVGEECFLPKEELRILVIGQSYLVQEFTMDKKGDFVKVTRVCDKTVD